MKIYGEKTKILKRFVSLIVMLVVFASFLPTHAVNKLVFTSINDVFQINPSPQNVPIKIGGAAYVLPETFTRVLGLKSYHNTRLDQLLIYNSDKHIVFDMLNGTATNGSDKTYYEYALRHDGKIYIPARLVCEEFGFKYSFITLSSLGDIVRINNEDSVTNEDAFMTRNAETMRNIYLRYTSTYSNTIETPPTQPPVTPPVQPPQDRPITPIGGRTQLLFKARDSEKAWEIFEALESEKLDGTIFLSPQAAEDGELLRSLYLSGRQVGMLLNSATATEDAVLINELLAGNTMNKTHLALIDEGIKTMSEEKLIGLEGMGLRIWDGTYRPSGNGARLLSSIKTYLGKVPTGSAIVINGDENGVTLIPPLSKYMADNKITAQAITFFDTPK